MKNLICLQSKFYSKNNSRLPDVGEFPKERSKVLRSCFFRFMRSRLVFALILALAVSLTDIVNVSAFNKLESASFAKVVEIVDGDAFIATLFPGGTPILVRLLGVDAEGFDDAVTYLNNVLLGEIVRLELDERYRTQVHRWNLAYVYRGNQLINLEILNAGNAKLNTNHDDARLYTTLERAAEAAEAAKIGIWAVPEQRLASQIINYTGVGININTATSEQLATRLEISNSIASAIVSYRAHNPFRTIQDIKFVSGFTKEMFDSNRNQMVVSTNINIAKEEELTTLDGLTSTDVANIIEYRDKSRFIDITELHTKSLISRNKFESNSLFVSTTTAARITATSPTETVININTATSAQLVEAGFSSSQASSIIEYRNGYSYKTVEELGQIFSFSKSSVDRIYDNVSIYTNINTAFVSELQSLLGADSTREIVDKIIAARPFRNVGDLQKILSNEVYSRVHPYVSISDTNNDYININTASRDEILGIGVRTEDVTALMNKQPLMTTSKDIPQEILAFDARISLFTNINTASRQELLSLDPLLTADIASRIIFYRDNQPFGDLDEVRDFFENISQSELYSKISRFLVLR